MSDTATTIFHNPACGTSRNTLAMIRNSGVEPVIVEYLKAPPGRTKLVEPSAFYDRVVDVMEELVKFTLLTRDAAPYLVDRDSERRESAKALSRRVNQRAI